MALVKARPEELTIDQLAAEAGMTSRNVRAYQSAGLMPAPRLRGRTGYYGSEHLARLRLIQELQAGGFNLRAIKRLLDSWGGSSDEMLTFKRAVLAPFSDEEPEIVSVDELDRGFGGATDARVARKAEELGIIRYLGDGRYEVLSPRLLAAGQDLVRLGVPIRHVLAVAKQVFRHVEPIADNFLRLFIEDVLASLGSETGTLDAAAARRAVERLRPLAQEAVLAAFAQAMTRATEREFSRLIQG